MILNKNRNYLDVVAEGKYIPSLKELIQMFSTFMLTVFAWIFFRSENLTQAILIINEIFSSSVFSFPEFEYKKVDLLISVFFLFVFIICEWSTRFLKHSLEKIYEFRIFTRWSVYLLIFISIIIFGSSAKEFIYFQF